MSCFFCESNFHHSQNCDTFSTAESRQKNAVSKNCCYICLTPLKDTLSECQSCQLNCKCYICLTTKHHTVYCPDRFEVSSYILTIDNDLLPRFLKLLNFDETYFLAIANPRLIYSSKVKPVRVLYRELLHSLNTINFQENDILIADKIFMDISSIILPTFTRIEKIEIRNSSFSSETFLKLLSTKTKTIQCGYTEFSPKLSFSVIVKAAPNLVGIDISQTNIEVNSNWSDEFLQYNKGNILAFIDLPIGDGNFNIESLVNLMKTKPARFVRISLYINATQITKPARFVRTSPYINTIQKVNAKQQTFEAVKQKLCRYFIPAKTAAYGNQCLRIFMSSNKSDGYSEDFVLKME